MLAACLAAACLAAAPPQSCSVAQDVDINPHTPGLGWVPASSIDTCCEACSSHEWWSRGCRFYTLSKGRCWLKGDNGTVVAAPGKVSGQATVEAPPSPPPAWPAHGKTAWTKVGPWGIGDDVEAKGESGTLADAVSPASNPNLIYAGGQNNGASSGVLKSTDRGEHWTIMSNGLFDTHVHALGIVDEAGDHVYCAVSGAIYETYDGAATWTLVEGSNRFGTCQTFRNGTINNEPYILVGCDAGIANIPVRGGNWSLIPPGGWGRAGYLTVSDSLQSTSVVGACLGGHVVIGVVINETAANWTSFPDRPCTSLALNPNNKDHFIYTKPPLTYQSVDGGRTFESLNNSNIFHAGIDRQGWLYTASGGGAHVSRDCGPGPEMKRPCSWQTYYDLRTQRRTNVTQKRDAHDFQRIALDFGGGVSFPSDQGLFIVNGTSLELIKANGNMSNNIALKASISAGDGPGKRYIVTAVWDWAPLASWDSGSHWPSWQTAEDGPSGSCIGEGGGSYAMGRSNHMLLMHHHNILASAHGGKNLTRFVTPHGSTVFGPTYQTKLGSRTEPDGSVYAPLFFGPMPWDTHMDKTIGCPDLFDIGQHATNWSCLAAIDLGVAYGWYKANIGMWRGDDDRHCYVCSLEGNSSQWNFTTTAGAVTYSAVEAERGRALERMLELDSDGDGRIDPHDLAASMVRPDGDAEAFKEEDGDEDEDEDGEEGEEDGDVDAPRGCCQYIVKNFEYGSGMNWTWTQLPPHLSAIHSFVTDPTSNRTLYGIAPDCIARSYDRGDTWTTCWNSEASGLTGSFSDLVIKDTTTMIAVRTGEVPLRTRDGGVTWLPLTSLAPVARFGGLGMAYSWTGKTLALSGAGGSQSAEHPHAAVVWTSSDDGDTWTDETADLVTMGLGIANWYEGDLYINTMGQGILKKILEETEETAGK